MYKTKIDNLDLKQIADSGQCFRWKNTGENEYTVVAFDRALRIKQDGNEFELDCDEADWNNIWKSYLDMDTDYAGIAKLIADGDDAHLKEAYAYGSGVRILRQDLWEMIVTFMISQNNNIKRITNSVDLLCRRCGHKIDGSAEGLQLFQFFFGNRFVRSVYLKHIFYRIATTVIQIRSCTPALIQSRNVHRQTFIGSGSPIYLILFQVGIILSGMTTCTVFLKNLLSAFRFRRKFTILKIRTRQRFQP